MKNITRFFIKTFGILLFFLFFSHHVSFAQLVITPNLTAQQLVDNLVGGGITVINPIYSGAANSRGRFVTGGNPTNLGIPSGIILSTGRVQDAVGPNSSGSTSTNNGTGSDPQLAALIPGYTIYDACYLQFSFIPESDTIKFRYVFGSDEYPEFVNSSFNDVFGFFISGPNPNGGNYVNRNIALIPGTNLPVTIDNVNQNTNSQYYVNNHSTGQGTVEYDGFTTVLTAWAHVVPCVQYTIKIAIGDAGDSAYDSAVFLEEGSFTSNAISITTSYSYSAIDTAAIKGCSDATVIFTTAQNVANDLTINFTVSGSAVPGVDYHPIQTSVTIPAGQNSAQFDIEPIFNGQPGPTVQVVLTAQTSLCSGQDSVIIYILNNTFLTTQIKSNDTMICGGSADLWIEATGGMPPYTYAWDNGGGTGNQINVSPTQNTIYTVTVTDDCGQTHTDQITVSIGSGYGSAGLDTLICQGGTATLTATGGSGYLWSTGSTNASITVQPNQTTDYFVTIYGACDGWDTVRVNVKALPVVTIKPETQSICRGEYVSMVVGEGNGFTWSASPADPTLGNQANSQALLVAPRLSTTYTVTATDDIGCQNTANAQVIIIPNPIADFLASPKVVSILEPIINFFDNSTGATSWHWTLEDGSNYYTPTFQHVFAEPGTYEVNLFVENVHGCVDSTTNFVTVRPNFTFYVPSAFTPNADLKNDIFYAYGEGVLEFEMRIFNRWGQLIFRSDDINIGWDGTVNNREAPEGVYIYKINYTDGFKKPKMLSGTVTLLR